MSTHQKLPSRRFHTGPSPKLMPSCRRSSSASRETTRASPGAARSISIMRVVRRDGDHARLSGTVAPRVPGPALHDGVAGFQMDFLEVEHERDLAFEHHAEIERARLHKGSGFGRETNNPAYRAAPPRVLA